MLFHSRSEPIPSARIEVKYTLDLHTILWYCQSMTQHCLQNSMMEMMALKHEGTFSHM